MKPKINSNFIDILKQEYINLCLKLRQMRLQEGSQTTYNPHFSLQKSQLEELVNSCSIMLKYLDTGIEQRQSKIDLFV